LQDDVVDSDYIVYGTPANIVTNLATIIPLINEDDEYIWWIFVDPFSYRWAKEDSWPGLMKNANDIAITERRSRNRRLDTDLMTMKNLDVTGKNINDPANAAGLNVQIPGLFQGDL
jgi:hypothetical protein